MTGENIFFSEKWPLGPLFVFLSPKSSFFFFTKCLFLIRKVAFLVEKVKFVLVYSKPIYDIQGLVLSTDMYTLVVSIGKIEVGFHIYINPPYKKNEKCTVGYYMYNPTTCRDSDSTKLNGASVVSPSIHIK